MKSILIEELARISLSREEFFKIKKIAKDFITSLKNEGVNAFIGGSLAKGTMINKSNKQDIDIFVVFNSTEDTSKLEKILCKIDLHGELKKIHGSRDYFQIIYDEIILEVIPVVKNLNPEMAENVTDVSLSHVKYIVSEIKKNPDVANEIKLAKAFCQAQGCYGAESYIRGFSGYSLEVLVIYFGGFIKFLKGVAKRRVIDPLKYFRGERDILKELNFSKLQGPLVLIDPTYKYRNISAGLGKETFDKFLKISKRFLRSPSLDYFEEHLVDVVGMKKMDGVFVKVSLNTDRQNGDIAGTKMKKFFDFFIRELERKQQVILKKEFDYGGGKIAYGYLVIKVKPEIELRGPSIGLEDASNAFLEAKGRRVFKKKNFWWYKKNISIEDVFNFVNRFSNEMGVSGKLDFL